MALTTYTWTTAGNGAWNSAANWQTGGTTAAISPSGTAALADFNQAFGTVTLGAASINVAAVSITANGTLDIQSGQTLLSGPIVSPGDTFVINAGMVDMTGGTLKYGTITVGGSGEIFGYGTIIDPAVGTLHAAFGTTGGGLIVADVNGGLGNGILDVQGSASSANVNVSGSYQVDAGAMLQFGSNAVLGTGTAEPVVTFSTQEGTLAGTLAVVPTGTLSFTQSGSLHTLNVLLRNLEIGNTVNSSAAASQIQFNIGSGNTISSTAIVGAGNGTLEAIVATSTYIFDTNGNFSGDYVDWTNSGSIATIWVDTQPCYAAGTRILTDRGEVAVEALTVGDMVVTLSGDSRPVRWIGERRISLLRHPQPNLAAPVRVRQHAFGADAPARDLLLSPDHCVFLDGRLVPIKLLINDMTILQELDAASVHYFHVELDRHAIMLAEGLPAESYLDTGNRAMFSNAGMALLLHPDFAVNASLKCWDTDACAPLTTDVETVRPIWQGIAARAESLGYQWPEQATSTDPQLRLVADGRAIRPLSVDGDRFVFAVPAGVATLRLASRTGVPSSFAAYVDDWRNLGVAVRRIVLRDSSGVSEIAPDHPSLTEGWFRVERDGAAMWRWMNGDATLPVPEGAALVEVHVGMTMTYAVAETAPARLAA